MDGKKRKRSLSITTEGVAKKAKDLPSKPSYHRGQLGRDQLKEATRHAAAIKTIDAQAEANLERFFDEDEDERIIENEDLPFSIYSMFESATSEEDNYGLDQKEMDKLWISVIEDLSSFLSLSTRPMVLLYHSILYQGIKEHPSPVVRNLCAEFMDTLIHNSFPPLDDVSRTYYLYAFSPKLTKPNDPSFDPNAGWTNLSQCLDEEAESLDYLTFLVDLLETDFGFWKQELVRKGKITSQSLLQRLIWLDSEGVICFNYKIRELTTKLVKSIVQPKHPHPARKSLLRRVHALVCDMIDLSERAAETDELKRRVVQHFADEFSSKIAKEKYYLWKFFLCNFL